MQEGLSGVVIGWATDEITYRASKGEVLDFAAQARIMDKYHFMLNAPSPEQRQFYIEDFADENGGPNTLDILSVWESFDSPEDKIKYIVLFENEYLRLGEMTVKDFLNRQKEGYYEDYLNESRANYATLPDSDFVSPVAEPEIDYSVVDSYNPLPEAVTSEEQENNDEIEIAENQAWLRLKEESLQRRQFKVSQGKRGSKKMSKRKERQDFNMEVSTDTRMRIPRNIMKTAIQKEVSEGIDQYYEEEDDNEEYSISDSSSSFEKKKVKDRNYYYNLFRKHKYAMHLGTERSFEESSKIIGLFERLREGNINTVSDKDLKSWYRHFQTTPDFIEDEDIDDEYFPDDYEPDQWDMRLSDFEDIELPSELAYEIKSQMKSFTDKVISIEDGGRYFRIIAGNAGGNYHITLPKDQRVNLEEILAHMEKIKQKRSFIHDSSFTPFGNGDKYGKR